MTTNLNYHKIQNLQRFIHLANDKDQFNKLTANHQE